MKILIANDSKYAHFYERLSWANAFNSIPGIQCVMYDVLRNRAFDVFDSFRPDIYIGQLYNLSSATIKCIKERPDMRVALRAGEWNDNPVDEHILSVTSDEISKLQDLIMATGKPDFIYTHYLQSDMEVTHSKFTDLGVKLVGLPMSADIHTYSNSTYMPELQCDIGFVGGYWPYKSEVIDRYLTPLCHSDFGYNIKIFGNQPWTHISQYCGYISDAEAANLFKSAKICPNLSEPHSHTYGVDVNERAFKVLAAGGFCIMDNVRAAKEMLPVGVVFVDSPEEFSDAIEYYLTPKREADRQNLIRLGKGHVLKNHTNYHRAITMLKNFNEDIAAEHAERVLNDYINNL